MEKREALDRQRARLGKRVSSLRGHLARFEEYVRAEVDKVRAAHHALLERHKEAKGSLVAMREAGQRKLQQLAGRGWAEAKQRVEAEVRRANARQSRIKSLLASAGDDLEGVLHVLAPAARGSGSARGRRGGRSVGQAW